MLFLAYVMTTQLKRMINNMLTDTAETTEWNLRSTCMALSNSWLWCFFEKYLWTLDEGDLPTIFTYLFQADFQPILERRNVIHHLSVVVCEEVYSHDYVW